MSEEVALTSSEILVLLDQQLDNFPTLRSFVVGNNIRPSSVFLPQTLKLISEAVDSRGDILFEALDFIDIVKFYSLLIYGDPEFFPEKVVSIILGTRVVVSENFGLNKEALSDFIFSNKEEAHDFLMSNIYLVSIYLVSLTNLILFRNFKE